MQYLIHFLKLKKHFFNKTKNIGVLAIKKCCINISDKKKLLKKLLHFTNAFYYLFFMFIYLCFFKYLTIKIFVIFQQYIIYSILSPSEIHFSKIIPK